RGTKGWPPRGHPLACHPTLERLSSPPATAGCAAARARARPRGASVQAMRAPAEGVAQCPEGRSRAQVIEIGKGGTEADGETPPGREPAHAMAGVEVDRGRPAHGERE